MTTCATLRRGIESASLEGGKRAAGAAKGRELHVIPGRYWLLQDTRKWAVRWGDSP